MALESKSMSSLQPMGALTKLDQVDTHKQITNAIENLKILLSNIDVKLNFPEAYNSITNMVEILRHANYTKSEITQADINTIIEKLQVLKESDEITEMNIPAPISLAETNLKSIKPTIVTTTPILKAQDILTNIKNYIKTNQTKVLIGAGIFVLGITFILMRNNKKMLKKIKRMVKK